ncbi:MAG: hypothetical protein U5L45_16865 [Saprospiraceae bacterium]|nr:hypothetical protein [Saprospiraceae bacterium]
MNHLFSFYASEASAKMPFNAYFEFMYGFKHFLNILRANPNEFGKNCLFYFSINA